jgi:hypothetical protein
MRGFTWFKAAGVGLALALTAGKASALPCLTNPGDVVGNPLFGATVATFVGLGINPATTCIENGLWSAPSGFGLGSYVKGAEDQGHGIAPATFAYVIDPVGSRAANANALDFAWVQDNANTITFSPGVVGGRPSQGIVWDLGGQANQLAVFVFVDHGPIPGEVLENTAWLSNDPNAPDPGWTQAELTHVYGAGWSPDPNIADGFVAVYRLPGGATFRYASVTHGGPGAIQRDGDNEIDAVGGLTVGGAGVFAPEPMTRSLVGLGLAGIAAGRRRRAR